MPVLPELVLSVAGMILLVIPGFKSARLLGLFSLFALVAALDVKLFGMLQGWFFSESAFSGMLVQDPFSAFFGLAILVVGLLVVLSVIGFMEESVRARREFHALFLFTIVGLLLVVSARHLALVYLGLEMVSILSYLLVGFQKRESRAIEGALKYFLFGAISTGAMLYGISLLYGLVGTMELPALAAELPKAIFSTPVLTWLSLLLIVVGLGFKIALVPFHMWAPDAYEGAPTPVASFLSLGPKLAGFAVLVRLFWVGFAPALNLWTSLFGVLAVLSMTLGNVVALAQTNVKRLLAYSSIAHAGTMLIGLAVATPMGVSALLYYLIAYLLMNAGAFAGVIAVENATGREDFDAFSGLSQRQPALAFFMAVCLLSLAGVPPLAGFFAKMWIFGAALQSGAVGLAVIGAVNSVVSLYYYVRIIKAMYLDPAPTIGITTPAPRALFLVLAFCAIGLFAVGFWQGPWLEVTAAVLPVPLQPGDLPWQFELRQ